MRYRNLILASAALSTVIAGQGLAATRTWVGGAPIGNYFDLPGNWSGGTPGELDTARFNLGTTYDVLWDGFTGDTTNAGLELVNGNVTFKRDSGNPRSHTVTTADFNAGRLNLSDITLNVTTNGDVLFNNLGRLDVNTGGTLAAPSAILRLGSTGSNAENLFVIVNGVANTRGATIGSGTGLMGRATINGASGRWNMTEDLFVANQGTGFFEVTTGAQVTNRDGWLGYNVNGVGSGIVTGSGSVWTSTRNLSLGDSSLSGVGNLTIGDGARLNVGDTAAAISPDFGYSMIDDSSTNASDGGTVFVYNGSALANNNNGLEIGRFAGRSGRVVVSGAGSSVVAGNYSLIGSGGIGFVNISQGGSYTTNIDTILGGGSEANGTVTVDGAGSRMWSKGDLEIRHGTVTTTNDGSIFVGDAATAGGFLNNSIVVNDASASGSNQGGLLTVANGSTLTHGGTAFIGLVSGQSGKVVITGPGSKWTNTGQVSLGNGNQPLSRGELVVENAGILEAAFLGGTGANSSIIVSSGGRVTTTTQTDLGDSIGQSATATVTGTNSTLAVGSLLEVGRNGTGTLNIQSAGKVTAADAVVGNNAAGVGTVNLNDAGSLLDVEGDLTVGGAGTGTVNHGVGTLIRVGDAAGAFSAVAVDVSDANLAGNAGGNLVLNNGSTFSANGLTSLGAPSNSYGRLAVNGVGSTFSSIGIDVGALGNGVLEVTAGGRVTNTPTDNGPSLKVGVIGPSGRGTVTVDGTGSLLDVNNSVFVGNSAPGPGVFSTLTVKNGGQLLVGDVAGFAPASVRVHVADLTLSGDEGGIIDVRPGSLLDASGGDVRVGTLPASFGRINLNGANARLLAANVVVGNNDGTGRLDVAGGTLTATGTVSIGGSVNSQLNLSGGTLVAPTIDASNGGFSFSGGRLETSIYTGSLTQNGGTFAPAGTGINPATVSISGAYTINAGTVEIGQDATSDDVIVATGPLTVGGKLTFTNLGYLPALGDDNNILVGSTRVGQFATITGLSLSPNLSLAVTYNATRVRYIVAIPGDATLNNSVGFEDLVVLAQKYNLGGQQWITGDFDGTGVVDFGDLVILAQHYNQSALGLPDGASSDFAADWALAQSMVPEPGTLIVSIPLLMTLARRRSWKAHG